MDSAYEIELQCSIAELNALSVQSQKEIASWGRTDASIANEKSESTLDAWDYCFSLAIGMAGARIATVEELGIYLNDIHQAASGNTGDYTKLQKLLGALLHHKGDAIDKLPDERYFINRKHDVSYVLFHRLLWGHDVLSFGEDNPFRLMFEQRGVFGIVQAVRHLIADTTSKQGLPIPGSSHLDYIKDDGKISNYLIRISQSLSKNSVGNLRSAQAIYAHMFTIRAQDIMGGGVITGFNEIYFKIRGIDDDIRKVQFRLISYTVAFLGESILGAIKQAGVPYVNISLASLAIKNGIQLEYLNMKEIKQLKKSTDNLVQKDNLLENKIKSTDKELAELLGED